MSAKVPGKKGAGGSGGGGKINPSLLSDEAIAAHRAEFLKGEPFPHLLVQDVFDPAFLSTVKASLSKAKYNDRCNDLFEFKQTDDLKTSTTGPVADFRQLIYSPAFRGWMSRITGIELNDTVDISSASYGVGSHLLCHDDDLSERRIAFIVYLIPEDWDATTDGGTLDLFDLAKSPKEAQGGDPCRLGAAAEPGDASTSEASAGGQQCVLPGKVVKRLTPHWNSIAFFEVSAISHHQVAEVLPPSGAKGSRLSISGWFHGKPVPRPPMPMLPLPSYAPAIGDAEDDEEASEGTSAKRQRREEDSDVGASASRSALVLVKPLPVPGVATWLDRNYLRPSVLKAAQAKFAEDASIQLVSFLSADKFKDVLADLGRQSWLQVGPANMRSYRVAAGLSYPSAGVWSGNGAPTGSGFVSYLPQADAVLQLMRVLCSQEFVGFLGMVTGLDVSVPLSSSADGKKKKNSSSAAAASSSPLSALTGEVRCFARGDYQLLFDAEHKQAKVNAKKAAIAGLSSSSSSETGGGKSSPAVVAAEEKKHKGSGKAAIASKEEKTLRDKMAALPASVGNPASSTLLEVTLCLTRPEDDAVWSEGECGGYSSFTAPELEEPLLNIHPQSNTLSLVLKEAGSGLTSFVKFVNSKAPGCRYDVQLQFVVNQ